MVDQCARTTSNSSGDRLSAKGSRAGGSIGSASVTSGWLGVVSSLIDILGDGGVVSSSSAVHAFRTCLVRLTRLLNVIPHFAHVYTVVCFLLLLLLRLRLLLRRHTDLTWCCRSSHMSNVASHLQEYFVRFACSLGGTSRGTSRGTSSGGATEYVCSITAGVAWLARWRLSVA